jgi:nicotinate-nucleotide adenylyltransferase
MRSNTIGIFGGIFDPVHNGHLAVAQLALEHFGLLKVYFVPSGSPPHKRGSVRASAPERLAMLRSAVKGNPRFAVRDLEVRRTGTSFSVDTISLIKNENPGMEIFFLIGSDNLREIPSWHRYRRILKLVTVGVAHRPGHSFAVPPQLAHADIRRFPSPQWGVSSTMVRSYISRKLSCRYLVPEEVLEYIRRKKLYR